MSWNQGQAVLRVRLHAIRDYYSMAALVAEHPGVHLTLNLTPARLWQIEVSCAIWPGFHQAENRATL